MFDAKRRIDRDRHGHGREMDINGAILSKDEKKMWHVNKHDWRFNL